MRRRRLTIALATLVTCAILCRASVARALIGRGDDFVRGGHTQRALSFYERAAAIDRDSSEAADRIAFLCTMTGQPQHLRLAVRVTSAALRRHPDTIALLRDRGLALRKLHDDKAAFRDYRHVADLTHAWIDYRFAAAAARSTGDRASERTMLRAALAVRPSGDALARRRLALGDR